MLPFFRIAALVAFSEGFHMRGHTVANVGDSTLLDEAYTFARFVREFGRTYEAGSEEYSHRSSIFQESLSEIHARNSRVGRSWTAGVYPFMDWTAAERAGRLHGYVPSPSRRAVEPTFLAALQTGAAGASSTRVYGQGSDSFENPAPPVRNQGGCGSCWAIASVEAVEAQIMKTNSSMFHDKGSRLSIQALLDCAQNPKHCGGNGGCEGATPELAFDFIQEKGLPLEADFPYSQAREKCNVMPYPANWARATITGWQALPSNQAQPLMQAIVESGPAAVSVAAHKGWYNYKFGIYDECEKDVILNHGVLAKGYGADDQGGKYWLLQNSWGHRWGEQGNIRLLRHDEEDHWCGTDTDPQKGSACDGDPHQTVTVCGSCGILYDAAIPQGGRVVWDAIEQDYQDIALDSDTKQMMSAVGDSGAARADDELASKPPGAGVANKANNSFVKVQDMVSQPSEVTRTRDLEGDVPDVVPSAQELQSSLGDDRLSRPSSQSESSAPWEFQTSRGDDSVIRPPLQSQTSAPRELQSPLGDDSVTQPPVQSETSAPPQEPSRGLDILGANLARIQSSLGDASLTPPSQSEMSAPQEFKSSLGDESVTQPPSQSETSAPPLGPSRWVGILGANLAKREKAMLDLRLEGMMQ